MTENGGAEEGSEDGCHHRSEMITYDYTFLESNHSRKMKNWERFFGGYSNLPSKTTHQNPTAGREQHPEGRGEARSNSETPGKIQHEQNLRDIKLTQKDADCDSRSSTDANEDRCATRRHDASTTTATKNFISCSRRHLANFYE